MSKGAQMAKTKAKAEPGFFQKVMTDDTANQQWDIGRLLVAAGGAAGILGIVAYIFFGIIQVMRGELELSDWATGFALILGGFAGYMTGCGLLFLMKAKGEGEPT